MNSKAEIVDLPNEVLETIFLKLPQFDVQHNVALVCRRFLDITRRPTFVQSVVIDLDELCIRDGLNKMEKVQKIFPNCNFHLVWNNHLLYSFEWMKEFEPYEEFITKLVMKTYSKLDLTDFLHFSNLSDVEYKCRGARGGLLSTHAANLESDLRQKMPNLQNLTLKYPMGKWLWKDSMKVSHTF